MPLDLSRFEVFNKSRARSATSNRPEVLIRQNGSMYVNQSLTRQLGIDEVEAFTLLFDRESHIVALQPAPISEPNSYKARPSSGRWFIGAERFMDFANIDTSENRAYTAEVDETNRVIYFTAEVAASPRQRKRKSTRKTEGAA